MTAANRSFSAFWQWIWPHYRKACFRTLVGVPVASLAAITLRNALICYAIWDGDSATACIALRDPRSALGEIFAVWWVVLFVIAVMLSQALLLEWLKYRKDEPSAFTHGGWTNPNRPWTLANLQRLSDNVAWRDQEGLEIQKLGEFHSRVWGNLTEEEAIKFGKSFVKRLTTFMPKAQENSGNSLRWRIRVMSGDELDVRLFRTQQPAVIWTLRVELYEWAGRKNPPKLARTYVTEFVCSGSGSTRP